MEQKHSYVNWLNIVVVVVSGPWVFPEHVLCLLVCWKDTFLFPGYYVELFFLFMFQNLQ